MPTKIKPIGFDHIVLNVADIERSLQYYCDVLGLAPEKVEEWRAGKANFPSVRVNADTIIDLFAAKGEGSNLDHYCLVIEPIDFEELVASGDLEIESGPVARGGARGKGRSVYVRDPDHNRIELRYYE